MKVIINGTRETFQNRLRNRAGDRGFHLQTKQENDRHIDKLSREYLQTHKGKRIVGTAPAAIAAKAAQKAKLERDARAYAVKNEPKRFLEFLSRRTNGIPGDKVLRVVEGVKGDPRSSWIESISTTANGAPIQVKVKGGKTYACPCDWKTAEAILKSKSIGQAVADRLFIRKFKIGKYGTKNQGKIVNKSNGRIAKIRSM